MRDKEVWKMEEELKATIRANMTAQELEQLELLEEPNAKTPILQFF